MTQEPKAAALQRIAQVQHGAQLAFIQQLMVVWTLLLAVWLMAWWWERSWLLALVLGGSVLMGFSLVLALEFAMAVHQHREDTAPKASPVTVVRAWWKETRVAATVFSWRQPFLWRRLPDGLSDRSSDEASISGKRPVVFVHGFVCNRGFWHPWMKEIGRRGIPYVSMNLEPVLGGIDGYVSQLEAAIVVDDNYLGRLTTTMLAG